MKKRIRTLGLQQVLALPKPRWRVKGILPIGAFTMIHAPQAQGKTFFALDLALSVAYGLPFHGRSVERGPVLYVLGEGSGGLGNRVAAWLKERGQPPNENAIFVLEGIQLHRQEDVDRLRQAIQELPTKPVMIVLDTFARCAVGLDENSATDVGRWVDAVRILQEEFRVEIVVLHHSKRVAKGAEATERGSTALIGATDTAIRLSKKDRERIVVSCVKQKDAAPFADIWLRLKPVQLGTDDDGELAESCVLALSDNREDGDAVTERQQRLMRALRDLGGQAKRKEWCRRADEPERTFDRARQELQNKQLIEPAGRGEFKLTAKGHLAIANDSPSHTEEAA